MSTFEEFKAAMEQGAGMIDRYGNVTKWNHTHDNRGRFGSAKPTRSPTNTATTPIITGRKNPDTPRGPKTRPGQIGHKP